MIHLASLGIKNGIIDDRFGKFALQQLGDVPTLSIPVQWKNLPQGTKSLALVMQDYDAVPVCGFSWLHWLVANIDPNRGELEEGASRNDSSLLQGKNSLASKQICGDQPEGITNFYSGPRPPDADHEYEIHIFALDIELHLKSGFRYNELIRAMRGHILDEGMLLGFYPSTK